MAPIVILSGVVFNWRKFARINNNIIATAERHIKTKNTKPPTYGKIDNIPQIAPKMQLNTDINFNKEVFIVSPTLFPNYPITNISKNVE